MKNFNCSIVPVMTMTAMIMYQVFVLGYLLSVGVVENLLHLVPSVILDPCSSQSLLIDRPL